MEGRAKRGEKGRESGQGSSDTFSRSPGSLRERGDQAVGGKCGRSSSEKRTRAKEFHSGRHQANAAAIRGEAKSQQWCLKKKRHKLRLSDRSSIAGGLRQRQHNQIHPFQKRKREHGN